MTDSLFGCRVRSENPPLRTIDSLINGKISDFRKPMTKMPEDPDSPIKIPESSRDEWGIALLLFAFSGLFLLARYRPCTTLISDKVPHVFLVRKGLACPNQASGGRRALRRTQMNRSLPVGFSIREV